MKTAHATLIVAIAISLSGCITGGKPKVTTPPAPQPAPAPQTPPPAAAPLPLSMPQTQVQLPPEQPLDPEALQPATPTAEVQPAPPTPTRATRKPKPAPAVTAPPPEPAAAVATPPASPPAEERGDVRQSISPAEQERLKNNADGQKRLIRSFFNSSRGRRMNANDPTVVRIKALLQASDEKEEKGDMREASDLADRAMGFLRELQSGR